MVTIDNLRRALLMMCLCKLITWKLTHSIHIMHFMQFLYKNDHKYMLSPFKMIDMIISLFIRIFLIFHYLITFYENFMTSTYQENNLLSIK